MLIESVHSGYSWRNPPSIIGLDNDQKTSMIPIHVFIYHPGTDKSHLGERKLIFKSTLVGDNSLQLLQKLLIGLVVPLCHQGTFHLYDPWPSRPSRYILHQAPSSGKPRSPDAMGMISPASLCLKNGMSRPS